MHSLIDQGQANVVPKTTRVQAMKLLEAEEAYRRNTLQHVEIPCGACGATTALIVSATKPRCSACGHALSSRQLKRRWPAEMKALLEILRRTPVQ